MFEIPVNSAKDLRPEVVDLVCQAFFKKKEMYYCDTAVNEDGTFRSGSQSGDSAQKYYVISDTERKAAIERFRDKGWHIFLREWYADNGKQLYSYLLHDTKKINSRSGHYIF